LYKEGLEDPAGSGTDIESEITGDAADEDEPPGVGGRRRLTGDLALGDATDTA